MSAAISPRPEAPTAEGWPALRALARVEAKRFARHPLFLLGIAIMLIPMVAVVWQQELDANPMTGTLFIAFLFGVFGFIVAHRLTTSMLRTRDLATTTPVGRQQRTLALCLACLVPATAGVVVAVFMLVTAAIWTPVGDPVTAHVAWFRDDPAIDVLATLIAMGPVAALGGPLLGCGRGAMGAVPGIGPDRSGHPGVPHRPAQRGTRSRGGCSRPGRSWSTNT